MSEAAAPADPGATIRSKGYRVLLVFAALIGVLVSFVSWCFLELVHWIQQEVYIHLPSGVGLHPVPWWWPLPVLAVAGVAAAVAIVRLPGHGGHIPRPPRPPRQPHNPARRTRTAAPANHDDGPT